MKVGGASGPLYGSLLMAMGKAATDEPKTAAGIGAIFAAGIDAVKARGKSDAGAKTMLEVLIPVQAALAKGGSIADIRAAADAGLASTKNMLATKGRAAFLGERSIGHLDPGARSSALLIHTHMRRPGGQMTDTVSIVIVSHSPDVAKGAADMVRQMVGEEVQGRLLRRQSRRRARHRCRRDHQGDRSGLDAKGRRGAGRSRRGGDEQRDGHRDASRRRTARMCGSAMRPVVEGAVMAATEAASGATLDAVRATAEDFCR